MALGAQSALEFLSTYSLATLIISLVVVTVYVLSTTPQSVVPQSCSVYGTLKCADVVYGGGAVTGSRLILSAVVSVPGTVNAQTFSAVADGVKSVSGYCTVTGQPGGPTYAVEGQTLLCVANFPRNVTVAHAYAGTFNMTANYCSSESSGPLCPQGNSYHFGGNWRSNGVYNAVIVSTSTMASTSTSSSSTSTSTTTSPTTSTSTAIYAYVQGGYVSGQGGSTGVKNISVINTATGSSYKVFVSANVGPVGAEPSCISITPDETQAYLVYANGLYVYNQVTNSVTQVAGISNVIGAAVAISPGGGNVYLATGSGDQVVNTNVIMVYTVNTLTNTLSNTLTMPLGPKNNDLYVSRTVLSPDGSRLYVAVLNGSNSGSGVIYAINTASETLANTIRVAGWPQDIMVSQDGGSLYAALETTSVGALKIINTATYSTTNTIQVSGTSGGLFNLAISPDGGTVYALTRSDGILAKYNLATNTLTKISLSSSPSSISMALSPDGTRAYVTQEAYDDVAVVDTTAGTMAYTIPISNEPFGIVLNSNGSLAYVTAFTGASVSVINTATNGISTINTVHNPNYIAIAGGSYTIEPT